MPAFLCLLESKPTGFRGIRAILSALALDLLVLEYISVPVVLAAELLHGSQPVAAAIPGRNYALAIAVTLALIGLVRSPAAEPSPLPA